MFVLDVFMDDLLSLNKFLNSLGVSPMLLFLKRSMYNEKFLWRTSHILFVPTNTSLRCVVSEKIFKISANQKQ
jgi:hypothetical protein